MSEMVKLKDDTVRIAHPMGIMETSVDLKDGQVKGIKVSSVQPVLFLKDLFIQSTTYDVCLSS